MEESNGWFRRVTFWSLLAGLTPLIPIPFVDDSVRDWTRRRQAAETFKRRGLKAAPWQLALLLGEDEKGSLTQGCLRWTLIFPALKLFYYLLKKVFRKVVIFLLLNDCATRFSSSFQEGFLLERAASIGLLDAEALAAEDGFRLTQARWAVRETCREVDPRPVRKLARGLFAGSRQLLSEAAGRLGSLFRRGRPQAAAEGADGERIESEEEKMLGGFLDRLTAALWHEEGYRVHLAKVFDEMVDRLEPGSARASASGDASPEPADPTGGIPG